MNQVLRMTPSFENRRRAVYTALIEHMGDDDLWESLAHWEDAHAGEPVFSPQKYLSEVLLTPALRQNRTRILQSLVRALSAPPATLLPDPREQLLVYRMRRGAAVTPAANTRHPPVAAFASLLTRILKQCNDDTRLRMRLFLLQRLDRSDMRTTTRDAIRNWMSEQGRLSLADADARELRGLLSLAYVGLCDYVGPVAADAMLSHAVRQLGEEDPDLLAHARELL